MKRVWMLLIAGMIFSGIHCSDVLKVLNQAGIRKPDVKITHARLAAINFNQADLLFDIQIDNPNGIGVSLAGFDYDLLLNDQSFLKGDQKNEMEIKAHDKATLQLPLSLNFAEIYKTYQHLRDEGETRYRLNTGFTFDLPVIGPVRVPVSASGQFPTIQLPTIQLKSLQLKNLSLSGANFNLILALNNPNSWGVILDALTYGLEVNGSPWISGQTQEKISLSGRGENQVSLPFSINFLKIGPAVYNVVASGRGLNYRLSGEGNLSSSLEILGDFKLPFDLTGTLDLER